MSFIDTTFTYEPELYYSLDFRTNEPSNVEELPDDEWISIEEDSTPQKSTLAKVAAYVGLIFALIGLTMLTSAFTIKMMVMATLMTVGGAFLSFYGFQTDQPQSNNQLYSISDRVRNMSFI
jgi:hypothetical protein